MRRPVGDGAVAVKLKFVCPLASLWQSLSSEKQHGLDEGSFCLRFRRGCSLEPGVSPRPFGSGAFRRLPHPAL